MLWDGTGPAQQRLREAFLLPDGPRLRRFVAEVRRTVDQNYAWYPLPVRRGQFEPLVQWALDELERAAHPRTYIPADDETFPPNPLVTEVRL